MKLSASFVLLTRIRKYPVQFICTPNRILVWKPRCFSNRPDFKKTTFREMQHIDRTDFNAMGYILLIIPAAAFGLGTWQVQRRKWKLNLVEDMLSRTNAPPIPFPANLEDLDDLEYRKVIVRGHFDHSRELYMMPRSPIEDDSSTFKRPVKIATGAHVITPFQLTDSNQTILVNRGWVPRELIDPNTRPEGQVTGDVDFVGIVRHNENRGQLAAQNDVTKNNWYTRDVDAMAAFLNTERAFIDADRKSTVPGGPVGGQTRVTLRNEHMQYIFTWYTLSAVTFFMWFKSYWRVR